MLSVRLLCRMLLGVSGLESSFLESDLKILQRYMLFLGNNSINIQSPIPTNVVWDAISCFQ
jgi:hypothetical protein